MADKLGWVVENTGGKSNKGQAEKERTMRRGDRA
jgi:hypothetical protein